MDGLVAVEVRPDNAVEADEVIDMVMGQEDGFKVREPIVAQYRVVAAVNQQRVVSALIVDEQTRVAGSAVEKSQFPERPRTGHESPPSSPAQSN
jgi:hypothetical protein